MKSFLLFSLLIIHTVMFAQEAKKISGKVTDIEDNSPLPGVNIFVKGTTIGVSSDRNGEYTINVPNENAVLVFSYVGYETKEISTAGISKLDVTLKMQSTELEELVVIAYGKVKKSDLTGSVGSIKSEELTKISSVSPEQALQGKLSGVRVTSSSGAPGEAPTVRIRGVGTYNTPDPIFVVDGIIVDNISFLNSSDIASIEVLKDASSTAMYGSRGANGVIMVTTKKGKISDKTTINVSANYELQTIQHYIDMLDSREFATVMNELAPGTFNNLNALINTDWQQLVYEDFAPTQNYQISISGGGERSRYYTSFGYFNQKGIIPKSSYTKYTIKINAEYELNDYIKAGHNITVTPFERQNAANVVASTLRAWPTDSAYNYLGDFYGNRGNGNPLASIEYTNSGSDGIRSVGNFYGEVEFLKYFSFKSSFAADLEYTNSKNFTPVFYVTPTQNNDETNLSKAKTSKYDWLWENILNFNIESGLHSVDAIVGYSAQEQNYEYLNGTGKNLLRDEIQYLGMNLTDITIENGATKTSIVSYLFRANYVYNGKYLLTATFRRDGSSKFSAENRWGNFPSAAVGWNVHKESFFKSNLISNLKLRASWGIVGNDKVAWSERFTLINNTSNAVFGEEESLVSGSTYEEQGNPELTWEEATQFDIGLELGMWNNGFTTELDYYYKKTKGILVPLATPAHLGNGSFATVFYNGADVLNQGIELTLSYKNNIGDLFYEIKGVGSYVHNEVLKLGGNVEQDNYLLMGSLGNGQNVKRVAIGEPIGYFYGYVVDGVFQNTEELNEYPHLDLQEVGDLRYKDINNDGEITSDDRTFIGSPTPDFIYGLSISLNYKGFFADIDFQGEHGQEIYDGKDAVRAGQYNYQGRVRDAWSGEGTSNTEPRITSAGVNYYQSDYFVFDGSFFRLRNITIGYTFNSDLLGKVGIKQANVFLRGTNVFTLTKYPGYTPEIGGAVSMNGIDTGVYPVTSMYGMGLNLTF